MTLNSQYASDIHLRESWLILARISWLILTALVFGLWIADTFFVDKVSSYATLFSVGMPVGFFVIAIFIFWRKPADPMSILASLMLVFLGPYLLSGVNETWMLRSGWKVLNTILVTIGGSVFLLFFYIFPHGQFAPRWIRPLFALSAGVIFAASLLDLALQPTFSYAALALAVCIPFGIFAQIYSYTWVLNQAQRQQAKWVMVGLLGPVLAFFWWLFVLEPWEEIIFQNPASNLITSFFSTALMLLLPLSIAISILRYRLFDIDLIIRRTLIYGILTALGFGIYFLLVGSTSLFLQSQHYLVATFIALALIALFLMPIRRRLTTLTNRYLPLPPRPLAEATEPVMAHQPRTKPKRLGLVWLVGGLPVGLAVASFSLFLLSWSTPVPATWSIEAGLRNTPQAVLSIFIIIAFYTLLASLLGLLIIIRRPGHPIGRLLYLAGCAFGLFELITEYTIYTNFTAPGRLPGGQLAALTMNWFWIMPFFLYFWMMAIFPDGCLPWSRWRWIFWSLALSTGGLIVSSFVEPTMHSAFNLDNPLPVSGMQEIYDVLFTVSVLFMPITLIGIFALMIYRFRQAQGEERQQIKWLAGMVLLAAICMIVGLALRFIFNLTIGEHIVNFSLVCLPVGIGIAILRYRLYDIDIIIRRTLIYGTLVVGLALIYFGSVALLQFLSESLTGPQSNLVVVAITLAIAALFNPVRRRFQEFIDRRFYREKVDARQALIIFAREVRTIIDLPELLRTLVTRTTGLLHIRHGAVFLAQENEAESAELEEMEIFQLAEGRNLAPSINTLSVDSEILSRLRSGQPVFRPREETFPLLIPLTAPTLQSDLAPDANHQPVVVSRSHSLIGILALGPRLSEQDYSREDQALLTGLADQAGTAIYVAQLIQEKQAEAQRREESERRLEAYRNSPMGRAEALAQELIGRPETALLEIHMLARNAGEDPEAADLLEHLSRALGYLGANLLTGLADGYNFIFISQTAPEFLPVGLRTLTEHLSLPEAVNIQGVAEALTLYQLCQQALEANSISQIAECGLLMTDLPDDPLLDGLTHGLAELRSAAEALRAYERVDTSQDKLAYLVSAVERLSHVDRLARIELGSADRPIVQRLANGWLAVVTGAMSELQTRAQLSCRLLTRHTWTGEIITLTMAVRNEGRGGALNLRINLAPAPEYTLLDETEDIERLAAGEERQVELRVRPRLAQGMSQFRVRFVILYDDPYGSNQVENFADVVYLLIDEGEFQFIPNPYVVGTPLQTGSRLFFGREDIISFIQENLAAAHRNNLVLIGQRRTGKTSLLKQLPVRLGDSYAPVYLDGQSLALDPGLANFFFSLATEITFALEDRGFDGLELFELADFADSPAATFERTFLPAVRRLIGQRHLLLLVDEFEELETAVRRGSIDASIFGFLRHLIQHTENLSVIFCGTHRMEELAADYWSVLFNISLYRHVAFLSQPEALRLIQEPVAEYNMRYDDLALDKMWRVTAGHPYFLQLLCHSLVNHHNKTERNYVTVADVNKALDEILAAGEAHFVYLWTESTSEERLALTALSRMMPFTGQVTPVQMADYLAEHGINLERRVVSQALHHLVLRDILTTSTANENDAGNIEAYRWRLGLLGLWVEKYKSLSRVVDEE